ncbi:histidine kinase [Streptomyces sp. NPDC048606]|uniref:sensor histidine kinase n=1 Tax=Streptomyces sp. NPDC048606 TaxID=3154726 RepID=UPI003414AD29
MRRITRTPRDWAADLALILFAACFAAVSSQSIPLPEDLGPAWRAADQAVGGLGCAALLLRRRWPVALAVVLLLAGSQAHYLTGPAMVAVFTVAATRPWRATAWVAALAFAPLPVFLWQLPDMPEDRVGPAATYFALLAGAVGWGLFRRSRRQLVTSLRARAELAETQARRDVREEIAREMHDVLGHRLSLLALHAGALEFNPGAPREDIARAAAVIRESAHLALDDLRQVIGVLREDPASAGAAPADAERPQPELADLERLVAETTAAGTAVDLTGPPRGQEPPLEVGRTAYRIVQEALTNVRKHAPDATARIRITGGPGDGLDIEVRNTRTTRTIARPNAQPAAPAAHASAAAADAIAATGGGHGLIGLAERARLAGGDLTAGPDGTDFRVHARLPWPDPRPASGPDGEEPA